MINRRNRITALLLSFMMIALNLFSGTEALYAYAETDADSQTITEETADTEQAEDTADAEEEEQAEAPKEETVPAEEAAQEEAAPVEEAEEEAEEEVAFSDEETLDGVTIKVTADEGVFPEGAELEVRDLTAKEEKDAKKAIDEITDEKADTEYLFDISVQKDGKEIEPEGDVKVFFETEEVADDNLKAEVIHVKDNGKAEELAVETKGEIATVETDGFSAYSLRFTISGSSLEYDLAYGQTVSLTTILDALGIYSSTYGHITSATASAGSPVSVVKILDEYDYYVSMSTQNPSGTHGIQVDFYSHSPVNITIGYHEHDWTLTPEGNSASLRCNNQHCPYYNQTFNATLSANGGVYKGSGHPYSASLSENMPDADVTISGISYYKITKNALDQEVETLLGSAPYEVGNYRAKVTITPHGGTAKTISTDYSITKADINLTDAAARELIYNGSNQTLHTAASAKSSTTSETFTVYYKLSTDSQAHTTLREAKNAGTYTLTYWAYGDDNHNNSETKTLTVTIAKRALTVKGIKAENRVYDSTTAATLNYSARTVEGVVEGESITVTATGTFDSKNAGNHKTVTLSNFVMHAGNISTNADNYTINNEQSETTTTANISKKMLLTDWTNAEHLQYNGQSQAPTAVIKPGDASNDNDGKIYAGDTVTVNLTNDSYNKEVGGPYEAHLTTLSGTDAGNYYLDDAYSHTGAEYWIVPREVKVIWSKLSQEYAATELSPTATVIDEVFEAEDVKVDIALNPEEAINAGSYKATASLSGTDAGNFTIDTDTDKADFTIKKAPLTVSASGWLYYGDTIDKVREEKYEFVDPTQFKPGDDESVLQYTGKYETDYGGKYAILDPITDENHTYTLLPVFENADNYEITNEYGELTVYPRPVTLVWTDTHNKAAATAVDKAEYTYDGKNHTYTAEVTEDSYVKINGTRVDPLMDVVPENIIKRDANAKTETEKDKYVANAVKLVDKNGNDIKNYSLQEVTLDSGREKADVETRDITFVINQLPIELTWKPAEFTYNAQNQRPTATIENLQTDDNGDKDPAFEVVFTPEESINAGDYIAEVTDLADKNYTIMATPGESQPVDCAKFAYTIKKAPLSIKSIAKTITYRDEAPKASEYELDVAGAGLQGDDTIESIGLNTSSLEFSCSYRKNDKPGSYAVVPSMDAQTPVNYTVNLENGTLQVNDKSLGLVARGLAKGKKKGALAWNGVTGATSYEVWMAPCSSKSFKRVATVGGTSYVTKKLKKNKFYKFYIVANTPDGRIYSSQSHFCTGNKAKKLTNAKSLKINAGSVGLNKGDSFTIGKSAKKAKKKLKFPGAKHGGNFRFMSDNPEVATVNGAGTITAVGSGWCRVYTQTTNGIWQVTEVYVY